MGFLKAPATLRGPIPGRQGLSHRPTSPAVPLLSSRSRPLHLQSHQLQFPPPSSPAHWGGPKLWTSQNLACRFCLSFRPRRASVDSLSLLPQCPKVGPSSQVAHAPQGRERPGPAERGQPGRAAEASRRGARPALAPRQPACGSGVFAGASRFSPPGEAASRVSLGSPGGSEESVFLATASREAAGPPVRAPVPGSRAPPCSSCRDFPPPSEVRPGRPAPSPRGGRSPPAPRPTAAPGISPGWPEGPPEPSALGRLLRTRWELGAGSRPRP
ncbi:hypothetical protein HPG69_005015 [Diceros bicornis minor]|uniref:Uncharacterized protein n=1 Tax=Diceros bicornis minor TaxID=77932 RepID=A0A7J7ES01_DICBM|nr:hypothetical protein HPG69_005015 [Diceros bicornis minor]